ncbi:MAG: flagellar motor switch protein FliG [Deltaproteobacteria bacterium]|nr:MAG: flagellar motor switch protein FliG [Deltaproteobacteria bacterium]RLC16310.1 MAG: flagellar motor switch protein FliG [Deltaproteobacteria bacterium]
MDPRKLAGPLKVAMLINSLGEKASQAVLGTLSVSEQEKIKRLMPQVDAIPVEVVDKVAREFIEQARGVETESNLKKEGKGSGSRPLAGTSGQRASGRLGIAQFMDPDQLAQILQEEHPQTLALILSYLDSDVAGEVLARLPTDHRADIAVRIAKLGKVNPWILDEIEAYLASSDKQRIPAPPQAVGGLSQLADIIKNLDDDIADTIMEHIESNDDDLAEGISQMLFVFNDIVMVDDKGMQQVLRNVETQDLAMALKAAADETQEKIFKNMSSRATAMLTEEIDSMGPVRMTDVTQAQQKITQVVQEMEKKGELIIQGRGGEEFIG